MKAKRFLLFGMDNYYPQGGFNDLIGMADTQEEIEDIEKKLRLFKVNDYYEIIDLENFSTEYQYDCCQEKLKER